ncbi:ABC transporter [Phytophthora megakarya]|uniref:ABC transporter n=1 Tax=Phytophthora megakarya TaxID=4795 RepID=A0A225V270_9STRA|nr:ABC transporter [Phytophthora megakarya]
MELWKLPLFSVSCSLGFLPLHGIQPASQRHPIGLQVAIHDHAIAILLALVFSKCDGLSTYDTATQQYVNIGGGLSCQRRTSVGIDQITIKEYIESVFEYKHDEIWCSFGIVLDS